MKTKTFKNLLLILLFITQNNLIAGDKMITEKLKQFVPVVIKYDHSLLNEKDKQCLKYLYYASKIMDTIFLNQAFSKNFQILDELQKLNTEEGKATLEYFKIMFSPFDRLDHHKAFYGNYVRPLGANFYPEDMTKEEFNNFIKANPDKEKEFTSEFTVIRRIDGKLVAIPYSEYYKNYLKKAAEYLREAAKYTDNQSFKKYLLSKADAFLSNDYYQSDVDWMDLKDHLFEFVIGPFEIYEDELFNYKASFEAFLTIVDPKESAKLKQFEALLDKMEQNLPIDDKYKNFSRGKQSPMYVVNQIFSAGDTKAGVQTLAFNLPNDERVRAAKGSKKVMQKNIHEAKFEKILFPIAQIAINENDLKYVTFDGFFNHTLMHEISHGLGPGFIKVNGKDTEVKKELKELYSKIEECKADVLGMYNNIYMIELGVYPENTRKEVWASFLANIFRSVRFGINEAHGASNAIIFNWMLEKKAYKYDKKTQKVSIDYTIIYDALKGLAKELLEIQATGDYARAKKLIEKYGKESEPLKVIRKKMVELPIDIKPVFEIEKEFN
ncbi:MAG TPA: peptidase [Ignavibacteriales bacterium]|nr:peptidase [Ignavibacteriales bacterium]HOL82241.1 peptidase [Ignavibacteriales bacterium]HOM66277.1 peptidase [Ignavibacteriales bacterium]HPD68407.1 peptidase [Ignavibacteriales bacterium]HPP34411.1 peptidase [Ignavibacteriales bacterium]